MPEVFLKAVTVVRNLGYPLNNFYTALGVKAQSDAVLNQVQGG